MLIFVFCSFPYYMSSFREKQTNKKNHSFWEYSRIPWGWNSCQLKKSPVVNLRYQPLSLFKGVCGSSTSKGILWKMTLFSHCLDSGSPSLSPCGRGCIIHVGEGRLSNPRISNSPEAEQQIILDNSYKQPKVHTRWACITVVWSLLLIRLLSYIDLQSAGRQRGQGLFTRTEDLPAPQSPTCPADIQPSLGLSEGTHKVGGAEASPLSLTLASCLSLTLVLHSFLSPSQLVCSGEVVAFVLHLRGWPVETWMGSLCTTVWLWSHKFFLVPVMTSLKC